MREILFRGKRLDNGEWVSSGNLIHAKDGDEHSYFIPVQDDKFGAVEDDSGNILSIEYGTFYKADPATVGQCTGLKDKNGKLIFEGDVVRQTFVKTVATVAEDWGNDEYDDLYGEDVGVVVILPSKGVCIKNPVIHRETNGEVTEHGVVARMYKPVCSCRCEVIGNIHDNPELLEAAT